MLKLTKYYRPFAGYIALIILFMFGQAVAELFLPTLMSDIVNKGMVTGDTSVILQYGAPMIAVALSSAACAIAGSYFSSVVSIGIGRDLRSAVFAKAESFSVAEYDKFGAASLITRTTNDVVQIQQSLVMFFRFLIYSPLMCIGGLVMAVSRDIGLTVVFLVAIPLIVVIMTLFGKAAFPLFRDMQKRTDRVNLVAREGLTGVRVIRAFNKESYELRRFDKASRELMENSVRVNRLLAMLMPAIMLILSLTTVSIIWFGGLRIASGHTDLGGMMAFIQYASIIMFSFVMISMLFIMLPRASASAERVLEILQTNSGLKESDNPVSPNMARGLVEFKEVTFFYEGAETPALNNVSFTAEPGKTTAIIGGTGAGKSTLISLIPRFYDVSGGKVLIDGANISDMEQRELREMIGYVPQKALLFSGTIAGNIRYGNENATDEEVKKAAETAQAAHFINNFPDGYNHMISQGGMNVSGGQRQRLSIARALVRRPLIYVFDDSFSALDMKTDASLRAALKRDIKNATVIIVAQRISSITDADKIIVLDNGEVAGAGTHAELMENCGVYREIAESQA